MTNPMQNRLRAEYEKIARLVFESGGTLQLLRTSGTPPVSYVIEYHCPSLVRDAEGKLLIQNRHQIEINLGMNYPQQKPTARMLTSVFNPHVYSNNAICLGPTWNWGDTLDTIVLQIGALLQLDPKVLNSQSPANSDANQWVQANRSKIPLGAISFKAGTEPAKRIQWS